MPPQQPFSKRHDYLAPKEVIIREDAPANLRYFVLQSVYDLGWTSHAVLKALCKLLRTMPFSNQKAEYQVREENEYHLYNCDWYRVYDFIEFVYAALDESDGYEAETRALEFAQSVNEFFLDEGIGWQSVDGVSSHEEPKPLKQCSQKRRQRSKHPSGPLAQDTCMKHWKTCRGDHRRT